MVAQKRFARAETICWRACKLVGTIETRVIHYIIKNFAEHGASNNGAAAGQEDTRVTKKDQVGVPPATTGSVKRKRSLGNGTFDQRLQASQEGGPEEGFVPLTAEQAARWRAVHPPLPVAPVLLVQVLAGVGVALLFWLIEPERGWVAGSAFYGVLAAWVPALVFARAELRRRRKSGPALGGLVALMVWEGVKVLLTVAMLLAAFKVLAVVHWPALVVGFVVTIKAAWLALWWLSTRRQRG